MKKTGGWRLATGASSGADATGTLEPGRWALVRSAVDTAPASRTTAASPVVETEPPAATAPATKERARRAPSANRPPEPTSDVSLESVNIVTSESALAAVFILKRSEPLSHRVEVRWRAESGTAKVGVDLSANVSGIAVLPEGHTRRAIYVPLLNDQTKEDDETFTLRLEAVRGARLVHDTAYATILDDD